MIGLSLAPRLYVACRCTVCKQLIDVPVGRLTQDRIERHLFGFVVYSFCPCCGQNVPEECNTGTYRHRADKWIARKGASL